MADKDLEPTPIKFTLPGQKLGTADNRLPRLLLAGSRAAGGDPDRFVNDRVVEVEAVYDLTPKARGEAVQTTAAMPGDRLLALEADDGTTLFIRADKLKEDLLRLYPDAVSRVDELMLEGLRDRQAASRGGSDWPWSRLSILNLKPDAIIQEAKDKALEIGKEWLGEKVEEIGAQALDFGASWLGSKALMWAIERRLAGQGLFPWRGGDLDERERLKPGDKGLAQAARKGPLLVFLHGTASHTMGSFSGLPQTGGTDWQRLTKAFDGRIFGYEHRTFSESPIDNALDLANVLPQAASVFLVSHSRGGLVGDLMCLGAVQDGSIDNFRRSLPQAEETSWQKQLREQLAEAEREKLRELVGLLKTKKLKVERYVRVACPARGTTLLSDNLDVFLSSLLNLIGFASGATAHPVYRAFQRIVLEIAHNRIKPQLVPGIEAMLTDSPLVSFLSRVPRHPDIRLAVIAGDIEGGGFLKRLAVMFTDWMFFDAADNDLIVDTESMYAGIARAGEAGYLFLQEPEINHFRYFTHPVSRDALVNWITSSQPNKLDQFKKLAHRGALLQTERRALEQSRSRGRRGFDATKPVVVLVPGIMGSHLEKRKAEEKPGEGDRVWFDFLELSLGGLSKIRYRRHNIEPEGLFNMFYGDLAVFLEDSHEVVPFPYDWRKPIQQEAARLGRTLRELSGKTQQPIRVLAHSMGGLLVRAMIALDAQQPTQDRIWEELVARKGAQLVMLGTPNNGAHLMVETLLGKSGTVRMLAKLDLAQGLQDVLDIIAEYRGALQLLPRPGFNDSGGAQAEDYYRRSVWLNYRELNRDRWYGNRVAAQPGNAALREAVSLWRELLKTNAIPNPEIVSYVFGQAERTACGVTEVNGRLKMVGTAQGDGSVTWQSGRLDNLPESHYWYMPVEHAALTDTESYFPGILELLNTGSTRRLASQAPEVRAAEARATTVYDAAPPVVPGEEELARSLLGGRPRKMARRSGIRALEVGVSAMDLRFSDQPVMCGHYLRDTISGAEAQIDKFLVNNELTRRNQLGLYAGEIGTTTVVMQARSDEERRRGSARGGIIVGLGELGGQLGVTELTNTIRSGALNLLLDWTDRDNIGDTLTANLTLASLLIGYNSTTHITIEDSMAAIVLGVCEANQQYNAAIGRELQIRRLEFIELYLDAAISAAHAAHRLNDRLGRDLARLATRIEVDRQLNHGEGARQRLEVNSGFSYWPKLIVTDADREDHGCSPECFEVKRTSPMPRDRARELLANAYDLDEERLLQKAHARVSGKRIVLAERLKYLFLGERARAEAQVHQRQPGLIEVLVQQAIRNTTFNEVHKSLCRTLFQLMVPIDLKAAARQMDRLVLVLDGYTANLPWEMLVADEEPLVLRTRVVRQLVSQRRPPIHTALENKAYVVGNPSTAGFSAAFPHPHKPDAEDPVSLFAAEEEAMNVVQTLRAFQYDVESALTQDCAAGDVINKLFKRPYRILHVAAHGVHNAVGRDGKTRSGVILSDGLLLTAAEIGQLESVPELVFLNCCHLAKSDATSLPASANRLAYSLARELIEKGVRCVIAAGWAVHDSAAQVFAEQFYKALLHDKQTFGDAVFEARKATKAAWPLTNTWGAYQAYGDPGYVMTAVNAPRERVQQRIFVSPDELLREVEALRVEAKQRKDEHGFQDVITALDSVFDSVPEDWEDRPDVQAKLGGLYAELGVDYFAKARKAFLSAIAAEDKNGKVPIKVIEQLANLESRTGENKGDEEGLQLIDRAINRLEALCGLAAERNVKASCKEAVSSNSERWGLLGSAHKSKAIVLLNIKKNWSEIRNELEASRDAYALGGGDLHAEAVYTYPMLNRLQLDGLLVDFKREDKHLLIRAAERCAERARKDFNRSGDFFDAVMPADAEMTIRLINQTLDAAASVEELKKTYDDALTRVPKSARQWNSVVRKLRLLAKFLRYRRQRTAAQALGRVADYLDPETAVATDTNLAAGADRRSPKQSDRPVAKTTTAKSGSRKKSKSRAMSKKAR